MYLLHRKRSMERQNRHMSLPSLYGHRSQHHASIVNFDNRHNVRLRIRQIPRLRAYVYYLMYYKFVLCKYVVHCHVYYNIVLVHLHDCSLFFLLPMRNSWKHLSATATHAISRCNYWLALLFILLNNQAAFEPSTLQFDVETLNSTYTITYTYEYLFIERTCVC